MIDKIRAWLAAIDGDFITSVEAEKFVAHAREKAPAELAAWLDERAVVLVTQCMTWTANSERARMQRRRSASVFAEQAQRDDEKPIYDVRYIIDDQDTRRRLGEMVWADIDYAAGLYEETAQSHAFEAYVLRAIQKRLPKNGTKSVADVFTETQLRALRQTGA